MAKLNSKISTFIDLERIFIFEISGVKILSDFPFSYLAVADLYRCFMFVLRVVINVVFLLIVFSTGVHFP